MNATIDAKPMEILLVEDNYGDVSLTLEGLKDCKIAHNLYATPNGIEALKFLRREADYVNSPRPDIILLDLNLPRKDGREVLREIKADPSLRRIPVIVLTTSNSRKDITTSYDLHANCYIVKPIELEQFMDLVKLIESFWLTSVQLSPE